MKSELKILICFRFREIGTAGSFFLFGENKEKKRKKQWSHYWNSFFRLDADTFWVTRTVSLLCSAWLLLSWAPPFITPPFAEQLRLERGSSIHLLRLMFCASNDIYSTVLKIGNGTGALVFACREPMEGVRRTQTLFQCESRPRCLMTKNVDINLWLNKN